MASQHHEPKDHRAHAGTASTPPTHANEQDVAPPPKGPPRIARPYAPGPRIVTHWAPQSLAVVLIGLGLVGFGCTVFHTVSPEQPAVSLVLMIFGLCCAFPSILTDGSDQVSTMRAAVLFIVAAFVLVSVRQAFLTGDMKLDSGWVTVVLAALGAKAVQSVPEAMAEKKAMGSNEYPSSGAPSPPKQLL